MFYVESRIKSAGLKCWLFKKNFFLHDVCPLLFTCFDILHFSTTVFVVDSNTQYSTVQYHSLHWILKKIKNTK